jgi:hypothetical protein
MNHEKAGNMHDLGHELMMSISGYGGNIRLDEKMPYFEVYYYNYADEWIEE